MAKIITILVALLKAIPALESLVRQAISERDKEREALAANRREAKIKAADEDIDHSSQSQP
ncbi:hypothetical protein Ga0100231_004960 [Opitutaceae bacterium TAV4]|nr:hypothetical protein Ga0100231_004960 [Opitutaceae bacterium TAV4]RRK02345.1 hypothetical protein Ga0100230_004105 [Opitutaceae bacterium TAV3]